MGLNISKGNMYEFVTHTWNTVKGKCPHDCSYCYMKRWGTLKDVRFDEKELKTDLGAGNFIFVGSSCDMFANGILAEWIIKTLEHCIKFDNKYLFQTKDPKKILPFEHIIKVLNPVICTTIETDRWYPEEMKNSPLIIDRVIGMQNLSKFTRFVTIEPIMDFDVDEMVEVIKMIKPEQVNIGADSGNNDLPEPSYDKILELADRLKVITRIENKRNLERIKNNGSNNHSF